MRRYRGRPKSGCVLYAERPSTRNLGDHMVRFRNGWLVAVVALGLGAAACKKSDDAKKTDPANDKVADKTDNKTPDKGDKPAVMPISDQNAGDLALLPVDSEVVMGLNIAQLQQSALWKQFS